ncbi:MAG: PAS domain S-box protein [Hyphomonadaceae bacterium]
MIERPPTPRDIWRVLALAAAAAACVFLSHEFTREAGRIASIWPLNALLLATAICWRGMDWRVIVAAGAAANLAVNLAMGDPFLRSASLTAANVLEVAICIRLLRIERRPFNITVARDLIRFILVAGLIAPAISSVAAATAISGDAPFADTFLLWFAADSLGLLIFTPAVLVVASADTLLWRKERRPEFLAVLLALTICSVLVFGQSSYPLLFVIPPLLTLATFRLGIAGAGVGLIVVTFCAIAFAVSGQGPTQLADTSQIGRVLLLQAFLALMSITTLPIAAALADGKRSAQKLDAARNEAERDRARASQSEAHYRTLADHSTDIVVRFGPGGVITYVSPACRILGITPEEAIGKSTIDFAAPEDRELAARLVDALFAGPEPDRALRREFRALTADGGHVWLEGSPSIIRDAAGRPVEVVSTYRDVTARRALESALEAARDEARQAAQAAAASELRYRTMADISLDMIARTGFDGTIHFVSPSAETIMGFAPEELIGTTTLSRMHPDDVEGVQKFFRDLIAEGPAAPPRPYSFRAKRKDGRYIWLEGIPRVLFDASGRPTEIQDSVRDVTTRKEMEQALDEAKRAAEAAARAKADFLANMSHEIRTPLNSVIGYARLLTQSPAIDGEDRRYVELVSRASRALLGIVNDVLDLSAIDAGGLRLDNRTISIAALVEQVADEFAPMADAKGVAFAISLRGAPLEALVGDDGRLRQVLTNLVGNALKFTGAGEVRIEIDAHPSDGAVQRFVCSVHDTGIGVPATQIDALFERFAQADTSVSRHFGGTGLGLAISKNLIELMGGAIGARARDGGGSTFWFELTLPLAPGVAHPRHAEHRSDDARAFAPRRILVVDDLEENRELLCLMLAGHVIDQASSGAEALELLAAHPYDLVLMDVQMPGMDGKSATRIIRQDPNFASLPIVAVSAHALPERIASFMAAGMDDYLAKPIDPVALEAILLKWTGRPHVVATQPTAELMTALREKFVDRCANDLAALAHLSARADAREVRAIVHRLAGSAATFGYPDAGRAALAVDQAYCAGRAPSEAEITAVLEALGAVCAAAAKEEGRADDRAARK